MAKADRLRYHVNSPRCSDKFKTSVKASILTGAAYGSALSIGYSKVFGDGEGVTDKLINRNFWARLWTQLSGGGGNEPCFMFSAVDGLSIAVSGIVMGLSVVVGLYAVYMTAPVFALVGLLRGDTDQEFSRHCEGVYHTIFSLGAGIAVYIDQILAALGGSLSCLTRLALSGAGAAAGLVCGLLLASGEALLTANACYV